MIPYGKYDQNQDLHWQWYLDPNHGYRKIVGDSLLPFKTAALGTVIDIGSGDGRPCSLLKDMGFICRGVEPMERGRFWHKQHDPEAEIYPCTAEEFAESYKSHEHVFDYLYCLNTIEHMDKPECLIEIMRRIGRFGVIVTDNDQVTTRQSSYHTKTFNPDSFRQLFKDFDLKPLHISKPEFFGFIITNK